jgi:hypothetical protein
MRYSPIRPRGFGLHAVLLAAVLTLQGCAAVGGFDYARDVGSVQPTKWAQMKGNVAVSWRLGSPDWVSLMCQPLGGQGPTTHGCAMLDDEGQNCVIFAVEPNDFQDRERLAVLGHEAWHCFGAKHADGTLVAEVANPPVHEPRRDAVSVEAMAVVTEEFAIKRRTRTDTAAVERRQYEPVANPEGVTARETPEVLEDAGLAV